MNQDNSWYSDRVKKMFQRELEMLDEGKNPIEHLEERFARLGTVMSSRKFTTYIQLAVQEFYANYW